MKSNKKYMVNDFLCQNGKVYLSFKFIGTVCGFDLSKEDSGMVWLSEEQVQPMCRHNRIFQEENEMICIPRYASNIEICNLVDGTIREIIIPQLADDKGKFADAVKVGGKIYCFPENYKGILEYDIQQMRYEIYHEELNYSLQDRYCFVSNAILEDEKLIIPYYSQNALLVFDYATKKISNIPFPVTGRKHIGLSKYCDTYYILCDDMHVLAYEENEEQYELVKLGDWTREECIMGTKGIWHVDKENGTIEQFLFKQKEVISLDMPMEIVNSLCDGDLLNSKSVEDVLYILLVHNQKLVLISIDMIGEEVQVEKRVISDISNKSLNMQFMQGGYESEAVGINDWIDFMKSENSTNSKKTLQSMNFGKSIYQCIMEEK